MKNDSKFTNQKFKLVGTRVTRPDGVDKVTGRARYGADTFAPGQLVGAILRSPHAHAEICKIVTAHATALKGVHAVVTGEAYARLANPLMVGVKLRIECWPIDRKRTKNHSGTDGISQVTAGGSTRTGICS